LFDLQLLLQHPVLPPSLQLLLVFATITGIMKLVLKFVNSRMKVERLLVLVALNGFDHQRLLWSTPQLSIILIGRLLGNSRLYLLKPKPLVKQVNNLEEPVLLLSTPQALRVWLLQTLILSDCLQSLYLPMARGLLLSLLFLFQSPLLLSCLVLFPVSRLIN
jgi:hypothetical protein